MSKTVEQYFADWEGHVFGYGYGTGEPHVLPSLGMFLASCPDDGGYDYKFLEEAITATVAWLLINALCKADIIEYGTSPRYGWLTATGRRLKQFVGAGSADRLVKIVCGQTEDDFPCYPNACNCGPNGHEKGRVCQNPFWLATAAWPVPIK